MIFKWAFRELRHHFGVKLLFTLNLSLGLFGFLLLDAFKTALSEELEKSAKNILAADFSVSARRKLTEQEVQISRSVFKDASESRVIEMYSMVATAHTSRLVQIKAIDQFYPFYGQLTLASGENKKIAAAPNKIWVYPEFLEQMQLKLGDKVKIGEDFFVIDDLVIDDTSQSFRFSSLASKIYMSLDQLPKTKLISFGSTLTETLLYKLPPGSDLQKIKLELNQVLPDNTIQIQTAEEAALESTKALGYIADYLGLSALVALFMAALGSSYLFRAWIVQKIKSIAIYNALGVQRKRALLVYLIQVLCFSFLAAVLSLLLTQAALPLAQKLLSGFISVSLSSALSTRTLILSFLLSSLGSLLITYPFLRPVLKLDLSLLLQDNVQFHLPLAKKDILWFFPSLVFYWGLAVWQSHSLIKGSLFLVVLLGVLFFLLIVGIVLINLFKKITPQRPWQLKQAILAMARKPAQSLAVILTLGLGTLLVTLIPQMRVFLQSEIQAPQTDKIPSLFLFDIQQEQVNPLKEILKQKSISLIGLSPMVRARLIKHNGQDFERLDSSQMRTREEENEARFRNRGVNLSYKENIHDYEGIIDGKEFSSAEANPAVAEVSLEKQYAERLNINIGDHLTFDIQGVEVEAQVINFRRVQWNSFQPNFFILFQPGVLNEAPQTYLASLPKLASTQILEVQSEIVRQFPNISVIDVARLTQRLLQMADRMSWSLQLMAFLSIVAGFMVLYSILSHQLEQRKWDLNMYKILGATSRPLTQYLLYEFVTLAFLGAFLGASISPLIAHLISLYLFNGLSVISWPEILGAIGAISLLAIILVLLGSRSVLKQKASVVLREN